MDKYRKNRLHIYLSDLSLRIIEQTEKNSKILGQRTNKSALIDQMIVQHMSNPEERQKEVIRQLQQQLTDIRDKISREAKKLEVLQEINHVEKSLSGSVKKVKAGVDE